jgi:RimJ/RimL family protein N-acetyltransferase
MGVELKTGRLVLRELTAAEARAILDGVRDVPARWAAGFPVERTTLHACRYVLDHPDVPRGLGTFVFQRLDEGDLIGELVFLHSVDPAPPMVDIAYSLVPTARGRGYATEAVSRLTTWALESGAAGAVRASVERHNIASKRVLLASGFLCVGPSALDELWQRN